MKKPNTANIILLAMFFLFIGISWLAQFEPGQQTGKEFFNIVFSMLKILPCAFILIGLFEVWVKNETIIQHLGEDCGIKGYLWVLLLAGLSVGGLYVAFPIAESLYRKGASTKIIFTYLGFAGIFRIPMLIFEISFLGLPFTALRLLVTIPLCLLIGLFMGTLFKKLKN